MNTSGRQPKSKAPRKEDRNKFPPNLYMAGDSWIVDFTFRGERYRETLGQMSKTVAKERSVARKIAAAEGRLVVNGKRWTGSEWIAAASVAKIEDPTFNSAMERYLTWYAANRKANTGILAGHNAKPLKTFFGSYRLSQISPFLIEKYKLERRRICSCEIPKPATKRSVRCATCSERLVPRANATLNRELTLLKHAFGQWKTWNLARTSPMDSVDLFKEDNGRTRYLTQVEAERLLLACNEDFRVVVLVALHSGFRSSELKSLTWSSVDMANRSITVQSCYAKNSDTRSVPMSDEVFTALERLQTERDRKPEDLVFVNRYGKPWKDWRTAFQNALSRANLKNFRFHDLRHCYGSWLGMNSTNPKSMMELMGHRDPKMTLRYTHLSVEYNRQAVAKLPKFGSVLNAKSPQNPPQEASEETAKVAK